MSRGNQLQEMDPGTKQSKTAANANAKPGMSMEKGEGATWEDLGGPTPENYKTDDDSAKLKTPGATLKQVRDVVNKNGGKADPMKTLNQGDEVEVEDQQEVVSEEEATEEVVDTTEITDEVDIEEDVNALLGGEELSEDFRNKAKIIFEAALKSKVSEIKEALEGQYQGKLAEEVETIKEELHGRVDSYLEYVADEWFEENTLAVESGLKTEMTESFLEGMKGLFEEHYVSIPEEKYDVLENMVQKLDDMETKLNEQIEKNMSLNSRLAESVADGILDNVSEGLAATQKEKLASLAESVEFESETVYREKLETLKESYFSSKPSSPSANSETLSEGVDVAPESHSDSMSHYLKMLSALKQN